MRECVSRKDEVSMCLCVMTHSFMFRDSFICATWLIHTCVMALHLCAKSHSCVWHISVIYRAVGRACKSVYPGKIRWLCAMTHSSMFIHLCAKEMRYLCLLCVMTHSSMFRDSFICVPWFIRLCSFIHVSRLLIRAPCRIQVYDIDHIWPISYTPYITYVQSR